MKVKKNKFMLNDYIYKIKGHKVKEGIKADPKFKRSKNNL